MEAKPPVALGKRGLAFWQKVHEDLVLEEHENNLLVEACRTIDLIDALRTAIAKSGPVDADGKVMPAVVEARLQSVTLARLVASLRLPDDFSASFLDRGQRRGAARGTYMAKAKLVEMTKHA